jgi:hypothetical protein
MNTQELVQMAVQILLVPIMGAVATFVVTYLRAKSEQIRRKIDDDTINKYIYLAEDIIATAVLQVNQVFVEELKRDGKFDKERQQEAFNKCKEIVLTLLNDNAKTVIEFIFGDLNRWIDSQIEATVHRSK